MESEPPSDRAAVTDNVKVCDPSEMWRATVIPPVVASMTKNPSLLPPEMASGRSGLSFAAENDAIC